jgi:DNA-binding FrmR family transcriptional regulator
MFDRIDRYPTWVYIGLEPIYPGGVLIWRENMSEHKHDMEEKKGHCPHCSGKHKDRDEKEKKDLMNRLKRIEGQVRGVEGMLEDDAYCTDILIQVSAISSALNSFNKVLLANHMRSCVADNIREGNDEIIDELVVTLQKLMK